MNRFGKSPYAHTPHIKFVTVLWGGSSKPFGIVLLFDTITNEYKAYASGVDGYNVWEDIVYIANNGGKWYYTDIFGDLPSNPFLPLNERINEVITKHK